MTDAHDPALQYRTPGALEDRYSIYKHSSCTVPWHEWVFRQINLEATSAVLDIGCGPGTLWTGRMERLPPAVRVTLADQSEGMIREARARLPVDDRFLYSVARVDALPFEDRTFDVVLALHMLAHAESIPRAIGELGRVLRTSGRCYVSTPSRSHLSTLRELLLEYDQSLGFPKGRMLDFLAEDAPTHLGRVFRSVERRSFTDHLVIGDPDAIVRYYLSIFDGNGYPDLRGQRESLRSHVRSRIADRGSVETDSVADLFICGLD